MFHTVDTTTTYLLACTNREIHRPEDMCGGGDGSQPLLAFSFEAPTDPTTTDPGRTTATDPTTTDPGTTTATDPTTTDPTTTGKISS